MEEGIETNEEEEQELNREGNKKECKTTQKAKYKMITKPWFLLLAVIICGTILSMNLFTHCTIIVYIVSPGVI